MRPRPRIGASGPKDRPEMRFKVVVGEQVYAVDIPEALLQDAGQFLARLDRDMDL